MFGEESRGWEPAAKPQLTATYKEIQASKVELVIFLLYQRRNHSLGMQEKALQRSQKSKTLENNES